MKKLLGILTLLAVVSCGSSNEVAQKPIDTSAFPTKWLSSKPAIDGGELRVAIVQDSPFTGIFSNALETDNTDALLLAPITGPLFYTDSDFQYEDGGAMTMRYDADKKVIHLTLKKGIKWEDGAPVTMDDYIFAYKVIASPKYTGVRYDNSVQNIVGIEDYHAGKTKEISGLQKINDYQLDIHLKKASPFVSTIGGGLIGYIEPYHYLKDIPVDKLESSDRVRLKPLSWGPYKITQIIPGESVQYVPNENYYDKAAIPKVSKLIYKILPTTSVIASMKNGEFDVYKEVLANIYPEYKDFNNLAVLGQPDLYYQYIGFNLGHWDAKKGETVQDPKAKLANIELRKAMAYALNMDQVAKDFYNGLRIKANGLTPPVFKKYYDSNDIYPYNPEKAKQILDKLGYKDVNGDGYREDPQGKPFEISFAFPDMGDIAEPLAQEYIQNWKAVGLHVVLTNGRIMNAQAFFPMIESNKGYDIWIAAWSVGSNLDPSGLYDSKAQFNFPRTNDPENDKLISEINSLKAAEDPAYKVKMYREWQNYYMNNVLGFLPILFRYDLVPVNKRVKEYNLSNDTKVTSKVVDALTQTQPLAATK